MTAFFIIWQHLLFYQYGKDQDYYGKYYPAYVEHTRHIPLFAFYPYLLFQLIAEQYYNYCQYCYDINFCHHFFTFLRFVIELLIIAMNTNSISAVSVVGDCPNIVFCRAARAYIIAPVKKIKPERTT